MLGRGESPADIEANMGMVIEGISTTRAAYELAQELCLYANHRLFNEPSTKVSISKQSPTSWSNEFKAENEWSQTLIERNIMKQSQKSGHPAAGLGTLLPPSH